MKFLNFKTNCKNRCDAMSDVDVCRMYNVDSKSDIIEILKNEIETLEKYIDFNVPDLYEEEGLRRREAYYDMRYCLMHNK
jgi:hypothetical protein